MSGVDGGGATLVTVPITALYDLYSPFQYPWFCLNYFLALLFFSNLFKKALEHAKFQKIKSTFYTLSEDKKKNVITYIMQLLMTSMAFVLQIYGSWDILFQFEEETSQQRLDWMVFAIQTISVLYVWELCYRQTIGWPLLVHHLVTVLLIQLSTASFFDTQDLIYIRFAVLLGFYATTEQISFVALFCFRLNTFVTWHAFLFYTAAAQAFILKTVVTVVSIVYFCVGFLASDAADDQPTNWKWFWTICFLPLLLLLYASQLYACKILYSLAVRCRTAGYASIDKKAKRQSRRESEALLSNFENYSNKDDSLLDEYRVWRGSHAFRLSQAIRASQAAQVEKQQTAGASEGGEKNNINDGEDLAKSLMKDPEIAALYSSSPHPLNVGHSEDLDDSEVIDFLEEGGLDDMEITQLDSTLFNMMEANMMSHSSSNVFDA